MKQLALVFMFIAGLTGSAHANQVMLMTAACQQSEIVAEFIRKEYAEIPFANGTGIVKLPEDRYATGLTHLYVNPEQKGFTVVIEFPEDDVSCIVLMGDDFQPAHQGDGV